ncbi:MAG: hypothetical protein K0V04_07800 [Deltaproteobacteria bacterium]|nr:hypothetical protein [Deltaproteobacteria bacterium]
MTNVDQFESVFRSAAKSVFHPADIDISTVLVVTDLATEASDAFANAVRGFLSTLDGRKGQPTWQTLHGGNFASQGELLEQVERFDPSLVCTYRNLHSDGWRWPHSLGEYLDVLTQIHDAPVLVCPHPEELAPDQFAQRGTDSVMAVTDHLAGDDRLVNWAVEIAENDGELLLTHVEDERSFDRIIEVIGKIPAIDTDVARVRIREQLLKEPHDYIRSCRTKLEEVGARVKVKEVVSLGNHLADYKRLLAEHQVDLLVLNTRDDDQMAMHGLAYPLAVELRATPLLML